MSNIDIVKVFPYKIPSNSNDKIIIQDGGNITTNSNLTLPELGKQYLDIFLVNTTTTDVNLFIETTAYGSLPAKNYIRFTPNNLGTPEYVIVSQGLTTLAPINSPKALVTAFGVAVTQGTEVIIPTADKMNIDKNYGSGLFKRDATSLGFLITSPFIGKIAEFNVLLFTGGYGSMIFRFYNSANAELQAYRVYRPDKPVETIAGDPPQVLSAAFTRQIAQGDYFTISSTSPTMTCEFAISIWNNINDALP